MCVKFLDKIRKKALRSRYNKMRSKTFPLMKSVVQKGNGIEIGGPSKVFMKGRALPLYPCVRQLDNCNFSSSTIWEGEIQEGESIVYDKKRLGRQYILEATNLSEIPTEAYMFVLASHIIEHTANPLAALLEWKRVLKVGGILLMIAPDKDKTFDHHRTITSMEHLIDDYEVNRGEDDTTHFDEILRLHDISRDAGLSSLHELKLRSNMNNENRSFHHHVFDLDLCEKMLRYTGFEVMESETLPLCHHVVMVKKCSSS